MKLVGISCLCTVLFLPSLSSHAQQIQNVHADFDGEKAIITYDLTTPNADDHFKVLLYSSHDNFQSPLSLLVGDAGDNVAPGVSHKITWDAKRSLPPDFDKDVVFKVAARVVVSLHSESRLALKPLDFDTYKRGGKLNLEWNGGKANEPITVELFKGNVPVSDITEVQNNNLYSWSIPRKTKPGKDYSIRVSRTANTNVASVSQTFAIKPKTALWVKLAPVVVVGGLIAILSSSKDEEPDLPGPVTPD